VRIVQTWLDYFDMFKDNLDSMLKYSLIQNKYLRWIFLINIETTILDRFGSTRQFVYQLWDHDNSIENE
jgi:hypothetical protein